MCGKEVKEAEFTNCHGCIFFSTPEEESPCNTHCAEDTSIMYVAND